MGASVCTDRAALPEGEQSRRPPADSFGTHAAYLLPAAMVQPSDPAAEEALYDSIVMRSFVGVTCDADIIPDETTILRFRRLLEIHQLTQGLFVEINSLLSERGLFVGKGTIVDATIIHAPSSTKNAQNKRDPEMHQTRKGKQW